MDNIKIKVNNEMIYNQGILTIDNKTYEYGRIINLIIALSKEIERTRTTSGINKVKIILDNSE